MAACAAPRYAEMVVAMSSSTAWITPMFLLPIAPFAENGHVCEPRSVKTKFQWQQTTAGRNATSLESADVSWQHPGPAGLRLRHLRKRIRDEVVCAGIDLSAQLNNTAKNAPPEAATYAPASPVATHADVPIYFADALVLPSEPLLRITLRY
jgi:NADH-quinone oxidoreductase subunit G